MPILEVLGLVKSFGRRRVVDGVSFEVGRGEIVGLLGPNGAGKTTSFRMTCGLVEPDKGTVRLGDQDVTRWPFYRRAREGGMGYLPQQSSVFAKLTTEQNLLAMMELLGMGRRERLARCDELLERFRITHIRRSKAGKLSGGEKRRLEIARCLVSEPEIIMLDEPFAGIDPVTVQSIQGVIRELREHGISILITDHAAREILQITDRTYVISDGQVLCSGTANQIVAHDEVKRKYLGEIDSFAPSSPSPPRPHFSEAMFERRRTDDRGAAKSESLSAVSSSSSSSPSSTSSSGGVTTASLLARATSLLSSRSPSSTKPETKSTAAMPTRAEVAAREAQEREAAAARERAEKNEASASRSTRSTRPFPFPKRRRNDIDP